MVKLLIDWADQQPLRPADRSHVSQPEINPAFPNTSRYQKVKRCTSQHGTGSQPCTCLCFGFSQIILTFPFLLITLHFSQIGFTDDLTFIVFPPFKKTVSHCIISALLMQA